MAHHPTPLTPNLSPQRPPTRPPPAQVVDSINVLSVGKKDNTAGVEEEVVIADAGQTRPGTFIPDLSLGMR